MNLPPIYGRLYNNVAGSKYYLITLIALFFLIVIYYFLAWPIVGYDTDLWYHLSGGRYFWLNGTILKDAFFSYITPPKSWYNYYWLFQVIIYKIFQLSGYYGLIVLRCLLYSLAVLFIGLFFLRQRENQTRLLMGCFLLVSCSFVILSRELLVRPHLFSYLFIIVFLYILEFKKDKIWLLPVLGILWSNIHGIEYPVMFLIIFAYLGEIYYREIRGREQYPAVDKKTKWLLISVFYTVFLTPQIIKLIACPFDVSFQNAAYQHLYVQELLIIPFSRYFIYEPITVNGFIGSLQNLLILFTVACFLISLWKKKLRLSHGIMFFAALLLLTRHARFTYEFTLLSIPLMCRCLGLITENSKFPRRLGGVLLPVLLVIIPLFVFSNIFEKKPAYPLSRSNLPIGVAGFLNTHFTCGRILNEANTGGYLPFILKPQFQIFMDMQMTIFSDLDFANNSQGFADANVFSKLIQKYNPSFISVSVNRPYFKKVVEQKGRQFVPVFFDNAEILYVNNNQYPDLANKFELKAIDPFTYREIKYEEQSESQLNQIYDEAWRIYTQNATNYGANHILCSILIVRQNYKQALPYAENLIGNYPDISHGYALKGDVLLGMGKYKEAARLYKRALDMGQISSTENVYRNLYATYVKLKDYKKAYNLLSNYVNPFTLTTDYKDIYNLGMSAATVGKIHEAITFLKIAALKVPATDKEYRKKIEDNLAMLGMNK